MSRFRQMTEDEKSAWRALPATQSLLEQLRSDAETTRKLSLAHSFKGESSQAQALAGSVIAIDAVIFRIESPAEGDSSPPVEEHFVDPARRASLTTKATS